MAYVPFPVKIGFERLIYQPSPLGPKRGLVCCEDHGWVPEDTISYNGIIRKVCGECIREHCEIGWSRNAT